MSASESPLPTSRHLSADRPPGPRRAAKAAGLRSGGSLGQDRLIRPALSSRTDRRDLRSTRLSLQKIDGVPVFDTGATNLFTVVPTLTVPDRWIFPRIEGG